MQAAVLVLCGFAAAYQIVAILACFKHKFARVPGPGFAPPVSILKPVRGVEPGFSEAIRSHALQDYAPFEILFGLSDPADPAAAYIRSLAAAFPHVPIRPIVCPTVAPNRKAGVLIDLVQAARHDLLVVNDSDIAVEPDYLRRVVAPLADPSIGLVTCLYRAQASDWPSRFEALGIAAEFAPSALVAPLFGVSEFGFGSTLAFRRADLARSGGFASVAPYLADDYQTGRNLHALGMKNLISDVVVETRIAGGSWRGAWRHQLRWARTVRLSRPGGYAGLPVTFATLWALAAACLGRFEIAAALFALRLAMAFVAGFWVVGSRDVLRYFYLIPARDLWGVAVWAAGLFGATVEWRGRRLTLDRSGRIVPGPR